MPCLELSAEALAEVNAAFERAVEKGVYQQSTWKEDYRRRAGILRGMAERDIQPFGRAKAPALKLRGAESD